MALSTTASTLVAPTATHSPSPAATEKYVPLHRRTPSPSRPEFSVSSSSRIYSISELLQLSHQPEIKIITSIQKDRLREVLPELVMNRKMRKTMEYRVYQERERSRQVTATVPGHVEGDSSTSSQQEGRSWQRRSREIHSQDTERKNNAKVVDEADWRSWRSTAALIPVA